MGMERLDIGMDSAYSDTEMALHLARYLPVKALCRRARVLDIASGAGYAAHIMRSHWGASRVFAVDVNPEAVESAEAQYGATRLKFIRAEAVRYLQNTNARFNLVVSVETIEHVADPEEFLQGIKRVCEPGAAVYISAPNDTSYYGPGPSLNPYHRHVFTYDDFVALGSKVFGPPTQVMVGTLASGFAAVEPQQGSPASWSAAIDATAVPAQAAVVPGNGLRPATPDTALFYAALWGGEATNARLVPSAAYFAKERTFRMPNIGLVASGVAARPGASAVLLVPHESEYIPVLRHAKTALAGKIDLDLATYTQANVRRVAAQVVAKRPSHIDLWGEHAVRAYFDHLPPSEQAVGDDGSDPLQTGQVAVSCVLPGRAADYGAISGLLAFVDDVIYVNGVIELDREERLQFAQAMLHHLDRAIEAAGRGGARRRITLIRTRSRVAALEKRFTEVRRELNRIKASVRGPSKRLTEIRGELNRLSASVDKPSK
jgi:2-polyprenyl-3-methyl-5-hydroxy-6-metoxy-1,4-benzoquinol methylase